MWYYDNLKERNYYSLKETILRGGESITSSGLQNYIKSHAIINPDFSGVFSSTCNIILSRYSKWYVGYIDTPINIEPNTMQLSELDSNFSDSFTDIYLSTKDYYLALLGYYAATSGKLLDQISVTQNSNGTTARNTTTSGTVNTAQTHTGTVDVNALNNGSTNTASNVNTSTNTLSSLLHTGSDSTATNTIVIETPNVTTSGTLAVTHTGDTKTDTTENSTFVPCVITNITGITRQNDTPQNTGVFTDDPYTSNITQSTNSTSTSGNNTNTITTNQKINYNTMDQTSTNSKVSGTTDTSTNVNSVVSYGSNSATTTNAIELEASQINSLTNTITNQVTTYNEQTNVKQASGESILNNDNQNSVVTTLDDVTTLMNRLKEIQEDYQILTTEWANCFKSLFEIPDERI